jgi:multiple sugar transport system ATP-binding protein
MSLADRIAVLNKGRIEQLGTSLQMYYTPKNEFVARLFGEPEINIFPAEPARGEGGLALRALDQDVPIVPEPDTARALEDSGASKIDLGIRGVDVSFSLSGQGKDWFRGTVYANEPIGNKVIITVDAGGMKLRFSASNDTGADLDQPIYFRFNMKNAIFFNGETKEFITRSSPDGYAG